MSDQAPVVPDPPSASSIRLGRLPCLYGNCPVCPAYSHCAPCTLSDGTPYRIAFVRGGGREPHDGDVDRLVALFEADPALMEANWLTAWTLPLRRSEVPHQENTHDDRG